MESTKVHHGLWQRNKLMRLVRARPRLFIATACAIAIGLLLPEGVAHQAVTRWLIAWNFGTGLYVLLAAIMMVRSSSHHMRHRAQLQDDGQLAILVLVVVSAVASLAAIAGELAVVKDMHGFAKTAHVALAGCTVLTSWAFIQVMFTLHYAHDYYAAVCHLRPAGPAVSRRRSARLRRLLLLRRGDRHVGARRRTSRSCRSRCGGSDRCTASWRTCSTPPCSRC
jgi:uncharacterized membrane protein